MAEVILSGISLEQHETFVRSIFREEFEQIFSNYFQSNQKSGTGSSQSSEKKYINSIKGLADFLQCSPVTVQKLKNEGLIPFMQVGRKILFDPECVLAAMEVKNSKKTKK